MPSSSDLSEEKHEDPAEEEEEYVAADDEIDLADTSSDDEDLSDADDLEEPDLDDEDESVVEHFSLDAWLNLTGDITKRAEKVELRKGNRGKYNKTAPAERTIRYHKQKARETVRKNGQTLHDFFPRVVNAAVDLDDRVNQQSATSLAVLVDVGGKFQTPRQAFLSTAKIRLAQMEALVRTEKGSVSTCVRDRMVSIGGWLKLVVQGFGMMKAAKRVAEASMFRRTSGWRCIVRWSASFMRDGVIPLSKRGKHRKASSLIDDEDVLADCVAWLRSCKKGQRTPFAFHQWIRCTLLPRFAPGSSICLRTARNWLTHLGYKYGEYKQNVYYDGHERADVVQYRKKFCARFMELFSRMRTYAGDNMDEVVLPENKDEPEVVPVFHDEACYWANDDGGRGWEHEDHPEGKKKSRGQAIMLSNFTSQINGCLSSEELVVGKNQQGYWTNDHVVTQLREAIGAFEREHPSCQALFIFDNSSNHSAMSKDALVVARMNLRSKLNDKPIDYPFRPGWYIDADGNRQVQHIVHPPCPDHAEPQGDGLCEKCTWAGQVKGIREILQERRLWLTKKNRQGLDVDALLLFCKAELDVSDKNPAEVKCCARHRLEAQPDFQETRSVLEELCLAAGHLCLFLPKFHCELNPQECIWGASKRYVRDTCSYSFKALRLAVGPSIQRIPIAQTRRYFRRCFHLINAYRYDLGMVMARAMHKQYKSHRRYTEKNIADFTDEFLAEQARKKYVHGRCVCFSHSIVHDTRVQRLCSLPAPSNM